VQYRRHSKGLASLFAPHLHRALPHAFDLSFSPSRSLLLPLTLYSTLRDNKKRKKITLLAPAGAQALGSFLNLLHRTTRAFVLLAADEIRNPNPEKETKILKTKTLSPHTICYRQQYSAAKRRTQTGYRNTQQTAIDRWIDLTQIADAKSIASLLSASFLRVFADRVCARKMGCPG
jgi:hypothetical protein